MRLRFFSVIVLLSVLSSILMLSVFALSSQELASSSISESDQVVKQAYEAVLDAEKAGANVSSLLARLNDAADLLSEARMAFEAGSYENATRLAELSSEVGGAVKIEAKKLAVEADCANIVRTWQFIVGSVSGLLIVVSVSLVGYDYFKRLYNRRLLKMSPKVGQA